jgi:peptidoglycan/xylan/chitin deacetylase (PgdA/CDA1 family)
MQVDRQPGIMRAGTMEDGATALKNRADRGARTRQPGRRWSREPHHRRRRATAALALVGLALLVGVVVFVGSGGGAHQVASVGTGGFLGRIETLAGTGPGSFAAAETAAENQAIDRTLAYTPWVRIAGSQHRELALTFDDGPGPYTPRILAILRRQNVPATFFEVGVLERYFHASTRNIVNLGDTVGDHTFSHAPMARLSPSDQRTQLLEQARSVEQFGAPFPRLFRPPYGLWNSATLQLLHRYRMLMVLWTVDTADYRVPSAKRIVRSVLAGARPGAIILLHDAGGNRVETVAALPAIIAKLRARGYRFVTVPRLLIDNPAPHNQQISAVLGTGG